MIKQLEALQGLRHNWDTQWQDVHDITWPDGGDFTLSRAPGERRTDLIYDQAAALALEKNAAIWELLLTPRTQGWHMLVPTLPELLDDQEAREYFEELTRILFSGRNRPGSGFYDQKHVSYKSLGAYGNECFNPMPIDGGGISYASVHIGAVWVDVDDRGRIDTTFYKFSLSAKAADQKWGDRAPKCVKDALGITPFKDFEFLHVVKPRRGYDPRLLGPKGMPFESWEIALKDKEFIPVSDPLRGTLEESGGFRTSPYIYSRFTVNPSEKYGRGPAMMVYQSNSTLQAQRRSQVISGEMAVHPPLLTQSDGLFADTDPTEGFALVPSAMNPGFLDDNLRPKVVAFQNGYKHSLSEAMIQHDIDTINDAHLADFFKVLVDNPNMTATQALLLAQEKANRVTPVVGRQQDEALGPLIIRELDILAEQGALPDPPPVLLEAAGEYDIEYLSAATRIQKEEEIQSIRAWLSDVLPLAEIDPTINEIPDLHELVRFMGDARGVPASMLNSKEEVQAAIKVQAQAAAADQTVEDLPGMARAAKDLQSANMLPREVQAG